MWILMAYMMSTTINNPTPITSFSAPGYETEAACKDAASKWQQRIKGAAQVYTLCTKSK